MYLSITSLEMIYIVRGVVGLFYFLESVLVNTVSR